MAEYDVLDHFAGTGWGVACRALGLREAGVEIMPEAVASREAAGFETIYNDVWAGLQNPSLVPEHRIYIASPPCQTFSTAGHGSGREALDQVVGLVEEEAYKDAPTLRKRGEQLGDDRTALVLAPLAHIWAHRPEFVALEQVPTVLPVWGAYATVLTDLGYSVWTGILNSEDYGVPQTRKRAYLIARRDGKTARAPKTSTYRPTMFDALGWGLTTRPSPTLTSHLGVTRSPTGTQRVYLDAIERGEFVFKPVPPKASRVAKNGIGSMYAPNTVNVTSEEGAVLMSYPRDFPFQGSKTMIDLQIGNAVPPAVSKAVLRGFTDE